MRGLEMKIRAFIRLFSAWDLTQLIINLFYIFSIFILDSKYNYPVLYIIGIIVAFIYFVFLYGMIYTKSEQNLILGKSQMERKHPFIYILINTILSLSISLVIGIIIALMIFGRLNYILFFTIIIRIIYDLSVKIKYTYDFRYSLNQIYLSERNYSERYK
jgi:hypothetical protein